MPGRIVYAWYHRGYHLSLGLSGGNKFLMFTGIIETTGKIVERTQGALVFEVPAAFLLKIGDSIAVNGTCLTAVKIEGNKITANILEETWKRTNLGGLTAGDLVNLERPAQIGGRLDGHIVQGHVDGVGSIRTIKEGPLGHEVVIEVPKALTKYMVEKGSVAVDGISLTIIERGDDSFSFEAIPHTWTVTRLHTLKPGSPVNIEVDVVAKYVEQLIRV